MGLKSRRYGCPDCGGEFDILKEDKDPPPAFCPLCGADVRGDTQPIPYFARAGKATDGSLDKVYRKMESASYERAEQAAEMMGGKASDYGHIRMTNMKDNAKEGESSFIPPSPTPSHGAIPFQAPRTSVPVMGGEQGLATAQMIKSQGGSVGQSVMDGFRRNHNNLAARMARAGQMNRGDK